MKTGKAGKALVTLCACAIAWSANAARYASPNGLQARSSSTIQAPAGKPMAFQGFDVTRQKCVDALFYFLPGNTDYCHGIHEWARGDYDSALFDLKDAAGWANKNAQYSLGLIYYNGHHVAKNKPLGIAWLLLSAERRNPQHYVDVAVAAYRLATPDQRSQALALLKNMSPRYGDAFAAHRAKMHFRHAMARSVDTWNGGDGTELCITGLTPGGAAGHPASTTAKWPLAAHDVVGACVSTRFVMNKLHTAAKVYFKTLPEGHVDVGPLQSVKLPIPAAH